MKNRKNFIGAIISLIITWGVAVYGFGQRPTLFEMMTYYTCFRIYLNQD